MQKTQVLFEEMLEKPQGEFCPEYFRAQGYEKSDKESYTARRADAIYSLFTEPKAHIYKNDVIVGSIFPLFCDITEEEKERAREVVAPYPERNFQTNNDHYSPDYEGALRLGITGLIGRIEESKKSHAADAEAVDYLESMKITMLGLKERIAIHAKKARRLIGCEGYDGENLEKIAKRCENLTLGAPKDFAEALQLVWFIHTSFLFEGRYAMALGRMDQYLYRFFKSDVDCGKLTEDEATLLLENVFAKIIEKRYYRDSDDVVNICIGGVDREGNPATNRLSYCILHAVRNVSMPGPNLSARIGKETPDEFLDECLKVIGTGLGYPALMNDEVNMAALSRYGYRIEDIRNYSMVGCIENFITGMQPPWSDGRFDSQKYLEYLMLGGVGYDGSRYSGKLPELSEIKTMEEFMSVIESMIRIAGKEYVDRFAVRNYVQEPKKQTCPFLSCFAVDCIGRARDINDGGCIYPSVHGAGLIGVATFSDSLAAIEKVVFIDKKATLSEIAEAMKDNFIGHEQLHRLLLAAPKYGNNDDFVDKYAIWFTSFISDEFDKYKTYDGGGIYTAMASNTSNIYAGKEIGATPDGRLAGTPLSDAASPTYGKDKSGPTSTVLSVSKPDYTRCACGTVVNQKYSPAAFSDENRGKLAALIRTYFSLGGQEIQINSTSRRVLKDAMEHPELYASLVVRVSGFSALYTTLSREVQEDILQRTQHG